MSNEVISTVKAAEELNTTPQTIRFWIKTQRIPKGGAFQIGGRGIWRVYRWALDRAKEYA